MKIVVTYSIPELRDTKDLKAIKKYYKDIKCIDDVFCSFEFKIARDVIYTNKILSDIEIYRMIKDIYGCYLQNCKYAQLIDDIKKIN